MRLNTKITIFFFFLSIFPVMVLGFFSFESSRRAIEQNLENHLVSMNTLKESEFERWIDANAAFLRSIAQRPQVRTYAGNLLSLEKNSSQYQESLEILIINHLIANSLEQGSFRELSVLDPLNGEIIASSESNFMGKFRKNENYFIRGQNQTYIDHIKYQIAAGEPGLHISTPIRDANGKLIAVLAGHVDLRTLSEIISPAVYGYNTEDSYLVNAFNFFTTEPRYAEEISLNKAIYTMGVSDCLQKNDGFSIYDDYRGVTVVGAYHWLVDWDLCLLTEIDRAEAFKPIYSLRLAVLILAFVVAMIAFTASYIVSRPFDQAISEMHLGAEAFRQGDFDYRVPMKSKDELGTLGTTFNIMAAELSALIRDLEGRVSERTTELEQANVLMKREISERQRAEIDLAQTVEELKSTNTRLESFNRLAVDREHRMIELKQQINQFQKELGKEPLYDITFTEEG
jgi:C4-dicarboxylate-specific signal transduction histidine kinase